MSEEYIVVHKPASATSVLSAELPKTPKTPKGSRRKSIKPIKKKESHEFGLDAFQIAFKLFEQKINDTKQQIHQDLFESVYEETTGYFEYYSTKRVACNLANLRVSANEEDKFLFNPVCHVIPTIALFTGVNTQDYANLNEKLADNLRRRFSRNLFVVSEKNAQNLKSLNNSIVTQWENTLNSSGNRRGFVSFRHFFNNIASAQPDETQAESNSVIFVFKQFELIPKETVENFVSLISCYVEMVPIYFVIELASQSNVIYNQLNSSVVSKLCIKKLYCMSPEQYLEKLVSKLFIENRTLFRVSGEILKFLVDMYYEYNYSISSFIHAIKYCYFDHLETDSVNLLFLHPEIDNLELYQMILEEAASRNKDQTKSDTLLIFQAQEAWKKLNNQFTLVCRLLYQVVKKFPAEQDNEHSLFTSSCKSFADFYVRILSLNAAQKFTHRDEYLKVKNLLQIASANTVNEIFDAFLKSVIPRAIGSQADFTAEFLDDLSELEEMLNEHRQQNQLNTNFQDDEEISAKNDIYDFDSPENQMEFDEEVISPFRNKINSRAAFKVLGEINADTNYLSPAAAGKKLAAKTAKKVKQAKNTKNQVLNWLEKQFAAHFTKTYFDAFQFTANFCYSDLEKMKKRLFDVQRINVHNCLLNSVKHLGLNKLTSFGDESPKKRSRNQTNDDEDGEQTDTVLPLNVVYRLYLECGHMINLFDWLQAFIDKIENCDIKDLSEQKRKTMLSITELQFMGYIKPTSRKVDHVVKLTNGSCILALEN